MGSEVFKIIFRTINNTTVQAFWKNQIDTKTLMYTMGANIAPFP